MLKKNQKPSHLYQEQTYQETRKTISLKMAEEISITNLKKWKACTKTKTNKRTFFKRCIYLFYVYEYSAAVQMVVSHHVVAENLTQDFCWLQPCSLQSKDLFIIICKYTVAVFRHSRRGHLISLQMVVSHHVVGGIWTQDLRKSSLCYYHWAISPAHKRTF